MHTSTPRRIEWRPLLLEAFFVVLGVVLALGANEWREHHNRQQHAARALDSIRDELETNRQAVEEALAYHAQLFDTLGTFGHPASHDDAPQRYPDGGIFARGYTGSASLLTTAWEAANATDAVGYMDYDDVLLLARIYESQGRYENQARVVGQNIFARLFDDGHQGMLRNYANLREVIGANIYRECQLLEGYAAVLPRLPGGADSLAVPVPCQWMLRR